MNPPPPPNKTPTLGGKSVPPFVFFILKKGQRGERGGGGSEAPSRSSYSRSLGLWLGGVWGGGPVGSSPQGGQRLSRTRRAAAQLHEDTRFATCTESTDGAAGDAGNAALRTGSRSEHLGGGFEGLRGGGWGSFRCLCFKLKEGDGLVKLTGCREHHWFSQCFACAAASWEPPLPQCRRSASSTASTLQGFPAGNERLRSFRVPSQLLTPAGGDRSKVSGCFIPDRRERSAARLRPPASSPQPEPPGGQQ